MAWNQRPRSPEVSYQDDGNAFLNNPINLEQPHVSLQKQQSQYRTVRLCFGGRENQACSKTLRLYLIGCLAK